MKLDYGLKLQDFSAMLQQPQMRMFSFTFVAIQMRKESRENYLKATDQSTITSSLGVKCQFSEVLLLNTCIRT